MQNQDAGPLETKRSSSALSNKDRDTPFQNLQEIQFELNKESKMQSVENI
jgi:hypothetical protein